VFGALGYVEAAREVVAQWRAGIAPQPDAVVLALGSGGTVAGLAVGLAHLGVAVPIHAILVAEPPWVVEQHLRHLVGALSMALGAPTLASTALGLITVDRRYLGRGYGFGTPWGARASHTLGRAVTLDATYTEKAAAAALHLLEDGTAASVLYWHTLSSSDLSPLLAGAPSERDVLARYPLLFD
jgi:1-aminocyclopropane-1-carboxylate deaminase/D-cysteine desulfhydrase-like pyridoxal-dependent ACC family enzyme